MHRGDRVVVHRNLHMFAGLVAIVPAFIWTLACGVPEVLWPEVLFDGGDERALRVGASAVPITPEWSVSLAGGIPYRPALNVHDDLWARVVVADDGLHRIAMVSLDLIGFYYDDVVRVRQDIADRVDVDYVLIAATHTHSGPDTVDAWSPALLCTDDAYRQFVGQRVAEAVEQAVDNLRPARIQVASGTSGNPPLSKDTREPTIIDDALTVWQAVDADTGETIATSVHYAAHPILVPSLSFDVSSDFVHPMRVAIESGIDDVEGAIAGSGGVCVFFNGALGGRITPANTDPPADSPALDAAYAHAETYGHRLARRARELLDTQAEWLDEPLSLSVTTRRLRVPVTNTLLASGMTLCLIDRAMPDGQVNTEVAVVAVGPMEFFAVPGMLFPELVIGGLTSLPGSDCPDAPPEVPPLKELASQRHFICIGLANDMLGNIIPKMLWDSVAPYTTGNGRAPYGEIISPGSDAAKVIIDAFAELQATRAASVNQSMSP